MNKLLVHADLGKQTINRHIYGHFAEHLGRCVYEGLWVGRDSPIPNTRGFRNDVVAALKKINIPNIRWPGGCFADTYHWMDGIGPYEKRPTIVNVHWGGTTEDNQCGTHEFLDLCEQLGGDLPCEPYIAGNMGSGSVREMAAWLEYLTMSGESPMSKLRRQNGRDEPWPITFWGVGNENWGCGGNMRPQYYADLYRQYQSYCRHFTPGKKLYKVACGLTNEWNEILMREAGRFMDGLSVHYYTVPGTWAKKGSATEFSVDEWRTTMQKSANIETFIRQTGEIMDRYDPNKRIGIVMDEWGTWFDVEPGTTPGFLYQQNTMRDAVVAGLSLNIFNNHADRVHVANIAQTANVLQAVVLTDQERMLLTPTYHVFEMYKVHQNATLLPSVLQCDTYVDAAASAETSVEGQYGVPLEATRQLSASASRAGSGKVHLSLCNLHHADAAELTCQFQGMDMSSVTGRVLSAPKMDSMNTFDRPDTVAPMPFDGYQINDDALMISLPPRSVVVLEIN